jgi:hypothetical protein
MGCSSNKKCKTPEMKLALIKKAQESKTECIALREFCFEYYGTLDEDKKARLLKICNSSIENPDS